MSAAREIAVGVMLALAILVAGCEASVSTGDDTVAKAEVEKQAQAKFDAIAQQHGQAKFPPITCPGDLEAKAGASIRCSASDSQGTLGITVTVDSIDGDTAHLDFKGDDAVTPK